MDGFDPARAIFGSTLDDAEHRFLASSPGALDLPLALVLVHVLSEAANERLVGLNLATHFQK